MKLKLLPCLFLLALMAGCTARKEKIPETPLMQKSSGKMVVYQLMTRYFSNTKTLNKPWGTLEENGVGKFNDINETALHAIKELGITHVWYTGVIEHALLTDYTAHGIPLDDADVVKGRAGSPYAIKDYYDVNPDLAVDVRNRMSEFTNLVERTHKEGMKVLIDFIPNHVARKYHSDVKPSGTKDLGEGDDTNAAFSAMNNFYYLPGQSFQVPQGYNSLGNETFPTKDGKFDETPAKATGNDQFTATPNINDWFETVKLNYGVDYLNGRKPAFDPVPNTWQKMRDILIYWAGKNVDGFRCDMAEMVPVEFWQWAIPQVKGKFPAIVFIAEIYNPQQYRNYIDNGHFDFLYDKVQLYDSLRGLINQQHSSVDIPRIQQSLAGINDNMLHFLENHDEQRIASKDFAGDAWKAIPGMTVSALIDRAPVMIYYGQEVGEPASGAEGFGGDDGRTTFFDYWGVPEHQKWVNGGKYDGGLLSPEQKELRQTYADILKFAATNPAIGTGDYEDLTEFNVHHGNIPDRISVFARMINDERLIIVSGFNKEQLRIRIQLTQPVIDKFKLQQGTSYIGRDLLRSGLDVGLDQNFSFALDLPAYSSFIIKIK